MVLCGLTLGFRLCGGRVHEGIRRWVQGEHGRWRTSAMCQAIQSSPGTTLADPTFGRSNCGGKGRKQSHRIKRTPRQSHPSRPALFLIIPHVHIRLEDSQRYGQETLRRASYATPVALTVGTTPHCLPPSEKDFFDHCWAIANPFGSPLFFGDQAVPFFSRSGLQNGTLGQVRRHPLTPSCVLLSIVCCVPSIVTCSLAHG